MLCAGPVGATGSTPGSHTRHALAGGRCRRIDGGTRVLFPSYRACQVGERWWAVHRRHGAGRAQRSGRIVVRARVRLLHHVPKQDFQAQPGRQKQSGYGPQSEGHCQGGGRLAGCAQEPACCLQEQAQRSASASQGAHIAGPMSRGNASPVQAAMEGLQQAQHVAHTQQAASQLVSARPSACEHGGIQPNDAQQQTDRKHHQKRSDQMYPDGKGSVHCSRPSSGNGYASAT